MNITFGRQGRFAIVIRDYEPGSRWMFGTLSLAVGDEIFGNGVVAPLGVFHAFAGELLTQIEHVRVEPLSQKLLRASCREAFEEIYGGYWGEGRYDDETSSIYEKYTFSPNAGEYLDDFFIFVVPWREELRLLISQDRERIHCYQFHYLEVANPIHAFIDWFNEEYEKVRK